MTFLACCVLPDKKFYGNCLYWLNILHWKFFHLSLNNRICTEIFHCIEYIFYYSGYLSNLRLSWKIECALKFFTILSILLHSGALSNMRLPWKTEGALNSLYWIYIFYHSGFLSNLRLPWKTEMPWKFSLFEIFFVIQDFWTTCACPEITVLDIYFYHSGFLSNSSLPW